MDIQGKNVLVLGGWGLVGAAICRDILPLGPKRLVVSSLTEAQAREAAQQYAAEFPKLPVEIIPAWGSVFVRDDWKDIPWGKLLKDPEKRTTLIRDSMGEMTPEVLESSMLYKLIEEYRPHVIIDCINSATIFAYQDMYTAALKTLATLDGYEQGKQEFAEVRAQVEEQLMLGAVPQLIRHTQILHTAMQRFETGFYVKIGTSGTGGMGLNIPYTHSEEKPSRMLLTKSAMAGAHTLLLFLMARTPGGAIIKEFKPTAAIAWKKIAHGKVNRRGGTVPLYQVGMDDGVPLEGELPKALPREVASRLEEQETTELEEVFIDTGENGCFSRGEFEAITTIGQMEFITPEEIARQVVFEISGGNTGHDVLDGLDMASMGPTYRAGAIRDGALDEMQRLEEKHGSNSIAFENLGPPRLSKLLYEAHLLKRTVGSLRRISETSAEELSKLCSDLLEKDDGLRSRIVSIGIPILKADGKTLLRGPEMHVPVFGLAESLEVTDESRSHWADAGWVDLRTCNMEHWRARANEALAEEQAIPADDTSSRYHRAREWWHVDRPLDEGRLVGWLFIKEDKGLRMKR